MPVLMEYLDGIRKAREIGDGKDRVIACARHQDCDDGFVRAVVAAATTLSGCTVAYASKKFEARPLEAQLALDATKVTKDVNTKWGVFQTSVLEWECLFKPLPMLKLPSVHTGLTDALSITAPWVATVEEEITNPIIRMAQVWRRSVALGLPPALAGAMTEVWAYSKRIVLDVLTAPSSCRVRKAHKVLQSQDLITVKNEIPEVKLHLSKLDRVWDAQAE